MKFVTWNVNGLRACVTKGFEDYFKSTDADFFCIQETKMQKGQLDFAPEGYHCFWHSAEKKGYSGTAIFTKHEPLSVSYDFGLDVHNTEGRVITLEYEKFYMVNAYVPNSQRELARLSYRLEWEDALRTHLINLNAKKPVIYCGDLNVAHNEIDLKNPKSNTRNAGFTAEERGKMTELLSSGFCDSFRLLYPDLTGAYTWWSYMFNARANNAGWRIDYFIVSNAIKDKIQDCIIRNEVFGSDHCPVELTLDI